MLKASIIIPALNEELSIGRVLDAIPRRLLKEAVVVDGGSRDRTASVARSRGAKVVVEPRRGYGRACQAGFRTLKRPRIVVILDADFSDDPGNLNLLLEPIASGRADFVMGARVPELAESGALPGHVRLGNALACLLMRLVGGGDYRDCGPFRALSIEAWRALKLGDQDFGWNIEMQVKAARLGLRTLEVPVPYRRRIGHSKISGTVSGTFKAGLKILYSVFKYRFFVRV